MNAVFPSVILTIFNFSVYMNAQKETISTQAILLLFQIDFKSQSSFRCSTWITDRQTRMDGAVR